MPSLAPSHESANTVFVRPPAKLNLFLELLARREDGFHEIDTVMVPIDWFDQLKISRRESAGVDLEVRWLPAANLIADRLRCSEESLAIPKGPENLVHQALSRFAQHFELNIGFQCELAKSIPAGAGMGGASSDAAAALRCAALLCGIPADHTDLPYLASQLGSDVPFFLGLDSKPCMGVRARGRGEKLTTVELAGPLDLVVVYPAKSLSTARVYAKSRVPENARSAEPIVTALSTGNRVEIAAAMFNRLSAPAQEIVPEIGEILESMWQSGLRTCQLTGSGSACFAIADSPRHAKQACARLRNRLREGALVRATRTTTVPPLIEFGMNHT